MTLFGDFYFFGIAACLVIPAVILGLKEKNIKYYGFVLTLFFVVMAMKSNPRAIAYLVGYVVFQYILVRGYIVLKNKQGRESRTYYIFLLLSILPLAVWKITAFGGHSILGFMGISYMTFKTCQMVIEIYDGLIDEVKPFEFVYFLIFFPCISSGPIDRSRRFMEDLNNTPSKAEYSEMLGDGLWKVCLGMFYKFILASGAYQGKLWLAKTVSGIVGSHLVSMYAYGMYLFFDFAGYSLMAVGMSYILGIKSPENFNKPFIATDMKDFWNRWHMSLSFWFRDFVFSRFMMKAIRGKWFKKRTTGASVGFIINMGLMGVWHGFDMCYIIYGLYHGILLALTEIYQKKSKFHKKNKKKKWYKFLGWFITFNLVMFGFYIFSGDFTGALGLSWSKIFN